MRAIIATSTRSSTSLRCRMIYLAPCVPGLQQLVAAELVGFAQQPDHPAEQDRLQEQKPGDDKAAQTEQGSHL